MSRIITIGAILLFVSIILIFIGSLQQSPSSKNVKTAGGFFIGPFPLFGFGNQTVFYVLWAIAILIFILFIILR